MTYDPVESLSLAFLSAAEEMNVDYITKQAAVARITMALITEESDSDSITAWERARSMTRVILAVCESFFGPEPKIRDN